MSRTLVVILGMIAVGACTGDGADDSPAPDGGPTARDSGGGPSEDVDAAGPSMAGSSGGAADAGASDEGETVLDRCYGSTCVPSRLPPQPDLEFLEDMGGGWQRLMEADWELAPGTEGYRCMTLTVPEDVYIVAFSPQSPRGTHHATFGVSAVPSAPDQVVACGVGAVGERRLQGSGAGSEPSELPAGVAMPLHRGDQIAMNLHLFNVSEEPLSGRSGMWVKTVTADEVEFEAETVLAGPLALDIPVGRSTQTGGCTLRSDATLYAAAPHMHQTGVHLRATVTTVAGEVEVFDGDYDFNHQLYHDIDDVQLRAGDYLEVECTYENDRDRALHWGDSSLDEMCFLSLSLYPAIGYGQLPCAN
jgi:hypothetical protein